MKAPRYFLYPVTGGPNSNLYRVDDTSGDWVDVQRVGFTDSADEYHENHTAGSHRWRREVLACMREVDGPPDAACDIGAHVEGEACPSCR